MWDQGFDFVAGIDEAGRGPLAGPVVAAAVCLKIGNCEIDKFIESWKLKIGSSVRDSKQLSSKQREQVYQKLIADSGVAWGIGIVSEKVIDRINILQATKLAMKKSIENLRPDFLLIDGNAQIYCATPQKCIVAGDQKVFSISAAGIIAKVTRDKIMQKYHKKYPGYGFEAHKGYGTKAHFAALEKFGPCPIHRKTFCHIDLM